MKCISHKNFRLYIFLFIVIRFCYRNGTQIHVVDHLVGRSNDTSLCCFPIVRKYTVDVILYPIYIHTSYILYKYVITYRLKKIKNLPMSVKNKKFKKCTTGESHLNFNCLGGDQLITIIINRRSI